MKKLYFLFYILLFAMNVFSQSDILWQHCYGGDTIDRPGSLIQTLDGGYIICGSTSSNNGDVSGNHGGSDLWIIKVDEFGIIQWQNCYGGSNTEFGTEIKQTPDSGYIVVGGTTSNDGDVTGFHGNTDAWVLKINNLGSIQWQKSFGGSSRESATDFLFTRDSGYIFTGEAYSSDGDVSGVHGNGDFWVVKLNNNGSIQWQKCFGGTDQDIAYSIQKTYDDNFIIAGSTKSLDGDVIGIHGSSDVWIIKIDEMGTLLWQKCLGGTRDDYTFSIKSTQDSGFIIGGTTESNDNDVNGLHGATLDFWIVKLDSIGTIQWQKCLGGSSQEQASSINQTNDGNYIIAGGTYSRDYDVTGKHGMSDPDCWIVKLNSLGSILWEKCFGGSGPDHPHKIIQTNDGGFIFAAESYSFDGDLTLNKGWLDFWLVKLNSTVDVKKINNQFINMDLFPNPLNNSTTISFTLSQNENVSLEIYDISAKKIKKFYGSMLETGFHTLEWDATDQNNNSVENGIYMFRLTTNSGVTTKLINVQK
jgi:hypothetical protein